MKLDLSGQIINVNADVKEEIISISTGNKLSTYNICIDAIGKLKFDELQNLLKKYKNEDLNELDSDDNIIKIYRVKNSSYSHTNNGENDVYNYSIEIREHEKLTVDNLIIADIDCAVIYYDEKIHNLTNSIIINAIIKQTEDDRKRIRNNIGKEVYFDVIRKGINENAIRMRFDKKIWSKHDDFIKFNIILVQEGYDNGGQQKLNHQPLDNIEVYLAQQIAYSKLLEELLIKKELVSIDEVDKLKAQVEEKHTEYLQDYDLVDDVEDYDLMSDVKHSYLMNDIEYYDLVDDVEY